MIVPSNDMGDCHFDVIDDDTKIVSWSAVRPGDNEIVQLAVIEYQVAFDGVFDHGSSLAGRTKSDCVGLSGRQIRNDPIRRTAGSVIGGAATLCLCGRAGSRAIIRWFTGGGRRALSLA